MKQLKQISDKQFCAFSKPELFYVTRLLILRYICARSIVVLVHFLSPKRTEYWWKWKIESKMKLINHRVKNNENNDKVINIERCNKAYLREWIAKQWWYLNIWL